MYNYRVHICFERSGGFTGRKIHKEFDTDSLPASQARQLGRLLSQSKFFDLPLRLRLPSGGADRFNYTLTIQSEEREHTVEIADEAVPAELRPLLEWLNRF